MKNFRFVYWIDSNPWNRPYGILPRAWSKSFSFALFRCGASVDCVVESSRHHGITSAALRQSRILHGKWLKFFVWDSVFIDARTLKWMSSTFNNAANKLNCRLISWTLVSIVFQLMNQTLQTVAWTCSKEIQPGVQRLSVCVVWLASLDSWNLSDIKTNTLKVLTLLSN